MPIQDADQDDGPGIRYAHAGRKKVGQTTYERVEAVRLPTKRRYAASDWSGQLPRNIKWTEDLSVGIRFGNGLREGLFAAPGAMSFRRAKPAD